MQSQPDSYSVKKCRICCCSVSYAEKNGNKDEKDNAIRYSASNYPVV